MPMILLIAATLGQLPAADKVPDYLQAISVTIKSQAGQGSGVVVSRDDKTFVFTAAHVVDGLRKWLGKHFAMTTVHMGKPDWSWTTITIRGVLKVGNLLRLYPVDSSFRETLGQKSPVSPGYPWLLRELCKARDRYFTYLRARRFAANGGLVILDRFPLSRIKLMDGPQVERFVRELEARPEGKQFLSPRSDSALVRLLERREHSCYQQTVTPDVLIALRVDPEVAVRRKTDEAAASVREPVPVLRNRFDTCTVTVRTEMPSALATCRFDITSARRDSTWRSRAVSSGNARLGRSKAFAKAPTSLRVTEGAKSDSPAAV